MNVKKKDLFGWSIITLLVMASLYLYLRNKQLGLVGTAVTLTGISGLYTFWKISKTDYSLAGGRSYLRRLFTLDPGSKSRDFRYDYFRLMAVLLVIMVHAVDACMPFLTIEDMTELNGLPIVLSDAGRYAGTCLRIFVLSGNLLFLMLSGALLLPYKDEDPIRFYVRRIGKIIIPMLLAFYFYLWMNREITTLQSGVGAFLIEGVRRLLYSSYDETPFYWLLYVMLAQYLSFPFLRYMLKDMPYKVLTTLIAILLIIMTLNTYVHAFDFLQMSFIGWISVPILGYWVSRDESRRFDLFLLAGGSAALIALCSMVNSRGNSFSACINQIAYFTPIMMFLCLGESALVFGSRRLRSLDCWFIRYFSRYSFSIILMHWWCLFFLVHPRSIALPANAYALSIVYHFVLTVLLSFAAGFIFENYVLPIPMDIYGKLTERQK